MSTDTMERPFVEGMTPVQGKWDKLASATVVGARLHYAESGRGDPVVLLHKMGGWSGDWRHAAPLIADGGRRAIAFDLLAQGNSKVFGDISYFIPLEQHAISVMTALDLMGVDKIHAAGCSLGADVCLVMATLFPKRVRSITLTSMSLGDEMDIAALRERDASGFYDKGFDAADIAIPTRPADVVAGWFTDNERVHEMNETRRMAGSWMKPVSRGISRCDFPDYLRRVETPTLLLYGEHGHFRQFEDLAVNTIRNVKRVVLPGAGSFIHEDHPGEWTAAVERHIAEVEKAGR